MKLHLGCGTQYWDGWINVDRCRDVRADYTMDFRKIGNQFQPGTIEAVAMIHSFSYLNLWEAEDLLDVIWNLLTPKSQLIIEFPDIMKCAVALYHSTSQERYLEAVRGIYAFGMDEIRNKVTYTPYAFGWSVGHLIEVLRQHKFVFAASKPVTSHMGYPWRDSRVEAQKP